MSHLSAPHFHSEEAAYAFVEARIWPHGATCPKCGERERVGKMGGKSTRIGVYKCYVCRKPFTVRIGTVFEASHVPLHVWLQAIYLMVGSKKGISSNQLHRALGVTLKTAWFMSHRIREAMRSGDLAPMGGNGGMVEIDETFIGNDPDRPKEPKARGFQHKMKVLSLVDRATGRAKSIVVDDLTAKAILPILQANIAKEATVFTDDAGYHQKLAADFAGHYFVNHSSGEYVNRANSEIHTNTIEGFFSIFRRGMKGIYQHCGKRHLHRYMAEFDLPVQQPHSSWCERRDARQARLAGYRWEAPYLSNDWCLMPKKKKELSQSEQSKRFLEEVQRLIDAGELNPTEAEERFDRTMREIAHRANPSP